jgi:F-type H+-transporting ATPase subunit gamma
MAQTSKTIKRRIKSVANTRKITKAMEMVSASKMRKATQNVLGTRPYAQMSWKTIRAILEKTEGIEHPLLNEYPDAKKVLIVLFSSDRGLAGAYNAGILRAVGMKIEALQAEGLEVDVISIGKRGALGLRKYGVNIVGSYEGLSNKPSFDEILPSGRDTIERFRSGDYRHVTLAYTDFVSALVQIPNIMTLLPLGEPDENLGETSQTTGEENDTNDASEYLFEPSPEEVLNHVLPRLVETMVYQALLESAASEHSARMVAMKNATEAAGDMLTDLKFTYNRIRQAGITQEIAEISSGKAALE